MQSSFQQPEQLAAGPQTIKIWHSGSPGSSDTCSRFIEHQSLAIACPPSPRLRSLSLCISYSMPVTPYAQQDISAPGMADTQSTPSRPSRASSTLAVRSNGDVRTMRNGRGPPTCL